MTLHENFPNSPSNRSRSNVFHRHCSEVPENQQSRSLYYRFEQFESVSSSSNTSSSTRSINTKMTTFSTEMNSQDNEPVDKANYLRHNCVSTFESDNSVMQMNADTAVDHYPLSNRIQLDKLKLSPSCRISSAKITRVNSFGKLAQNRSQQVPSSARSRFKSQDEPRTHRVWASSSSQVLPLSSRQHEETEEHLAPIWSPPRVHFGADLSINSAEDDTGSATNRYMAGSSSSFERAKLDPNRLFTSNANFYPRTDTFYGTVFNQRNLPEESDSSSSGSDFSSPSHLSSDPSLTESESDDFTIECTTNYDLVSAYGLCDLVSSSPHLDTFHTSL